MSGVTTQLGELARSIFTDLGYTVTETGAELRAERKWRVVHVTAADDVDDPPTDGDYRCFVTWSEETATLERRLASESPDYEWAIIGVDDDGDYDVVSRRTAT